MSNIIVRMEHVRLPRDKGGCGLCTRGTKAWFDRHNLDFRKFLAEGYPVEVIESKNDALGNRVAAAARKAAEVKHG